MGIFPIGNFELGKFRNGKISNMEFRTGNFELGKFRPPLRLGGPPPPHWNGTMIYPFIEGENVYDANKEGESDNKDT